MSVSYEALLFALGMIVLLVAWLPLLLRRLPLSLPIICVGLGFALSFTPWLQANTAALGQNRALERLNEGIVLIALMGAGLRLDRPFSWRRWSSTWRLLGIVMPLTMLSVFIFAVWGVGLTVAAAVLLAGALAPTDPVLAADVQSGPPQSGDEGETRFGLTSEAGLNDGFAFPFVLLAIGLRQQHVGWGHWIGFQFFGDLGLGIAIGWLIGWAAGYLMFRLPVMKLSETGDGLVALGVTLIAYAMTALLHGNGFVAVFVAALTIRSTCPKSDFHTSMSDFSSQIERVLVMLVLIVFGWGIGSGLLTPLTWQGAALAITILLVIRPAAAWFAFRGTPLSTMSKRLMGFFGIRGIGTLFYLQYAFNRVDFPERPQIWAIAGLTILCSILVHGAAATPLMNMADQTRRRKQGKRKGSGNPRRAIGRSQQVRGSSAP